MQFRYLRMKEQRLQKQPEGESDILSWVSNSRKFEEKRNSAKEKALRLSKDFEEQDNIHQDDFEVDTAPKHSSRKFPFFRFPPYTSDYYYTSEEILKFKKPMKKQKKSLRKKEKLDLDALEAEAVSSGLGLSDLGSRNNSNRESFREAQERIEVELRSNAYHTACAKADEASKALRVVEHSQKGKTTGEEDSSEFGEDDEELRKSLKRARKVALMKQQETKTSGPEAIARLTSFNATNPTATVDGQTLTSREMQENKVVFTEVEEFVGGLQLHEDGYGEDVFMQEAAAESSDVKFKDQDRGWKEVKDTDLEESPANQDAAEKYMVPDETIHEAPLGKGLSGALKMLKDRGTLKETIEWGGRNMYKKKSKLLGIHDHDGDGHKEIRLERTDEYGRILTPKEAFRLISHKFHGKEPGKGKQEKRKRDYEVEQKIKSMKNSDTLSHSVERMREAQVQSKTPYLVLSHLA